MSIVGFFIEKFAQGKVESLLEAFATPEFKAAAEKLLMKGLLTAIPQMKLDMDNEVIKFPDPGTTVPIMKGLLNAVEDTLKKQLGA